MKRIFKIRASQTATIMGRLKSFGELPETCATYLKAWHANDVIQELNTKEINKGNAVEGECIDMCANVLNFGILDKNTQSIESDYFTGTCDVQHGDYIIDVKAPYCNRTFRNAICNENLIYKAQLQVYMHLYNKEKAILFYGLLDTPATDWSECISYSHIPINERWGAIEYAYNPEYINDVVERVELCREWIDDYETRLNTKLGKLINK